MKNSFKPLLTGTPDAIAQLLYPLCIIELASTSIGFLSLLLGSFLANTLNTAVYLGALLLVTLFAGGGGAFLVTKKGRYITAGRMLTYSMLVAAVVANFSYDSSIPLIVSLILPITLSIALVEVGEFLIVLTSIIFAAITRYYLEIFVGFSSPAHLIDNSTSIVIASSTVIITVFPTAAALMFIPIYQRKRAEIQLVAEKERLDVTLRSIADGVIALDREGRVTLLNNAAGTLTGYSQYEAYGKLVEEVFRLAQPHSGPPYNQLAEKIANSEQVIELPQACELVDREGKARLVAGSIAPMLDPHGKKMEV